MWLAFEHQNGTLTDLEFAITKVKRQRRGLEAKRLRVSPNSFFVVSAIRFRERLTIVGMYRRLKQLVNRPRPSHNQQRIRWTSTISSIRSSKTPQPPRNDLAKK